MDARKFSPTILALLLACAGSCVAQGAKHQPPPTINVPDRLVIGEQSFIDVGPPFDFYQIYLLQSDEGRTAVKRLTLAPGSGSCMPATVEAAQGVLPESLAQLLSNKNPCSIPEKALHREAKRCKHCLVFSGAHVTMQVACGNSNRLIRYEVLDRDLFEEHPNTPEQTSKTFDLLNQINAVLGKNILDRPIFSNGDESSKSLPQPSLELTDLADGKFDTLFADAPDKPSLLYAEAQKPHELPHVLITRSMPVAPKQPTRLPDYPPIAKAAHIDGEVVLKLDVAADGKVNSVSALSGPLMLRQGTVEEAKRWMFPQQWDFPKPPEGFKVTTTVSYRLNCGRTATH